MSSSAKSSRPNRRKASALSNPAQSTAANSNSLNSDGLGTSLLSSPQSKRKRKSTSSCNSSTPAAEPLDQPSASSSSQPTTTRSSKAIKRRNSAGSEQQVKAKVRKSTSKKSVTVATSSPEASRSGDLAGVSTATTDQASLDSIDLSEGSSSSLRTTRSSKSKTASKSAAVTSPASHSAKTSRKSFRKTKASTGSSTDRKPSGLAPPADQPTSSTDGARRKISQLSDHFPDLKTVGLRRFTRSLVKRLSHTSTPDLSTGEADKDTGSKDTNIFDSVTSASTEATTGNCNSSSCLNSGTRTSSVFPEGTASSTAMASSGGANNNGSADQSQDQIEMGRLQALLESRGISGHFFSALGPRMHGLLQRNNNHSINGKTQSLITGMQNTGDESSQLQSVMEMCQLLLMGNEETLGSNFPIKQVTPTLITLLQMEHNFDIMTNACRALTYMMEALPRSSSVVCTAIPTFLDKLKRIECMDVAEQALTALEMLSRRHSKSIVTAGGVATCLLYVDFFSIVAQRSAMNIAANCCYHLNPEEFNLIGDSIEALTLRIMSQDKKSVESTCLCFTRLVDNFQNDIAKLKEVAGRGLLEKTLQVLVLSPPVLSTNTFISVIRMLHLLCHTCPELAVQLLQLNVTDTLRFLLLGTTDAKCDIELVARTPQELHEIVCLIGELMPRLPTDGIFTVNKLLSKQNAAALASLNDVVWQWQDEGGMWRPYTTIDCRILETAFQNKDDEGTINALGRTYTVDFNRMRQTNDDTGNSRPVHRRLMTSAARGIPANMAELKLEEDDRLQLIRSNPKLAESFVRALFPVLYEVYNTSAGPSVRHECLAALCRIICHSDETVLREILSNLAISSHIANMLNSQDLKIQVGAVQLVCVLLDKLPDVFSVFFRREGVMHQIERLADAPLIRHASSTPALNLTTSVVSQQQQHGGPSALLSRAPHTAPIFGAPSFLAPPPTNATIPPLTSSNIFTNGFSTSFNHPSNIQRDTGGLTAGGILPSTGPSINLTQFFMPAAAHPVPHYASSTAMPARVVMPPISAGAIASPSGGPPSSFTVAPPPLGPPASFNPNAPVFGDSSYLGLLNSFAQSQPQHVGVLQQAALQELHNQAAAAAAAGFLLPAPTDAPNTVAPPASDLSSLTVPDNNNRNPPASLASSLAQWATVFPPSPLVFPPPDSNTTSNAEGLGAPPTWMLGGSPISATTSTQYPGSPFTDAALQLPRSVVPILEPPQHPPRRNSASTVVSDRRKSATSSRDGGANRPPPSTGAAVDKAVKRHERHQQRHERRERQLNISDMAPAASTSPRSPQAPVTRSRAQAAKERSSKSESEGASKSQRKSNEESRYCNNCNLYLGLLGPIIYISINQ